MADPEGGGILEELAKLVESALFPDGMAPASAPEPAALPAVAGMPSFAVRSLPCATCCDAHCLLAAFKQLAEWIALLLKRVPQTFMQAPCLGLW